MRAYVVSACVGDIISYKQFFYNKYSAVRYATDKNDMVFYIVETIVADDDGKEKLVHSDVFYGTAKVAAYSRKVNTDDIHKLEKQLPRIYHTNGTSTLLPMKELTTSEVMAYVGGDDGPHWYNILVVQDKAPRKVIIYPDVHDYEGTLPPKNKVASKLYNMDLRGNVLFIDEAFIE